MRWVPHAAQRPHKCAVIPFKGNHNAGKGFIDTGQILSGWDPHVYVSVDAVEQMARMVGWVPGHVAQSQGKQAEELRDEIAQLRAELDQALEQLDAVQVLKNAGFQQARPVGRPKKKAGV